MARCLLRRGHILLIGGGAAVVVSLSLLGYYTVKLVGALQGEKYSVQPESSVQISHNFTSAGQAAYLASVPTLNEPNPEVSIRNSSDEIVLQKTLDQLLVMEVFDVTQGVYNLTLSNPSAVEIEAGIILDSREGILNRLTISPEVSVVFTVLLVAGAAAVVAGAVLLILDRRRAARMKQFGDMSDLV